jgi:hypothetical protein
MLGLGGGNQPEAAKRTLACLTVFAGSILKRSVFQQAMIHHANTPTNKTRAALAVAAVRRVGFSPVAGCGGITIVRRVASFGVVSVFRYAGFCTASLIAAGAVMIAKLDDLEEEPLVEGVIANLEESAIAFAVVRGSDCREARP